MSSLEGAVSGRKETMTVQRLRAGWAGLSLGTVTSCYLGLLSAALVYGLVLAAVWRSHCCCVHPEELPTRAGQEAAPPPRSPPPRVPGRAPARALQCEGRSPSGFHVLP